MPLNRVVVVGASLAGLRAAEVLRREGFEGTLTMIGAEPHAPYDRPPLSKQVLTGEWELDRVWLAPGKEKELGLDLLVGTEAVGLDPTARQVVLADGGHVPYDGLVIATGADPVLPEAWRRDGVFTLRTLDDALAIRDRLMDHPRLVVVGGGFIGCEVASAARHLGLEVTVVETADVPLAAALGHRVATVVTARHRDHGVQFRLGVGVEAIEGTVRAEAVRLADGSVLPADLVVVGIGVRPATAWLADSGLELRNGVVCDARCAVDDSIVAAGDVACWFNERYGTFMRVEHWTNASEQAAAAARRLLHGDGVPPFRPVPYVWSDQHQVKLQLAGRVPPGGEAVLADGSFDDDRFVALYRDGELFAGVVTINWPSKLARYRRELMDDASWCDVSGSPLVAPNKATG